MQAKRNVWLDNRGDQFRLGMLAVRSSAASQSADWQPAYDLWSVGMRSGTPGVDCLSRILACSVESPDADRLPQSVFH